jgi:hypothetical protein
MCGSRRRYKRFTHRSEVGDLPVRVDQQRGLTTYFYSCVQKWIICAYARLTTAVSPSKVNTITKIIA